MRLSFAISCLALALISWRFSLGARLEDESTAAIDTDQFHGDPGSTNGATASELTDAQPEGGKPIDAKKLYHYYARLSFYNEEASPLELELIAGFRIRVLPVDASDIDPPEEDRCILIADAEGATTVGGTTNDDWKLKELTLQGLLEELFGSESKASVVGEHMQKKYKQAKTTWQGLTVMEPSLDRPYHAVWYNCQEFIADVVDVAVPNFANDFQKVWVSDAKKITGLSEDPGVGSIYAALGTAATQVRVPEWLKSLMGGPLRSIWDPYLEQRSVNHYTFDALNILQQWQRSQGVVKDFDRMMNDVRNADRNVKTLKMYAGLHIKQLEVWMAPATSLAKLLTYQDEIEKAGEWIEKTFGVKS